MASSENMGSRFWRWFVTPPSSATLWRRAAWGLWTMPIIIGVLLLALIFESSPAGVRALAGLGLSYLLVFGVPIALGIFCWRRARRADDGA